MTPEAQNIQALTRFYEACPRHIVHTDLHLASLRGKFFDRLPALRFAEELMALPDFVLHDQELLGLVREYMARCRVFYDMTPDNATAEQFAHAAVEGIN